MKKLISRLFEKKEVERTLRLKNNNKGFSLVELLIVIAIMGVLAVLAFNMFGGVLSNSKKRADDQMAKNIGRALLTYCIDSGDWDLAAPKDSAADITDMELVGKLMDIITYNDTEYGPMLSRKDPDKDPTDDVNLNAYKPQWNTSSGGSYEGWTIAVHKTSQTVTAKPRKADEDANVSIVDN